MAVLAMSLSLTLPHPHLNNHKGLAILFPPPITTCSPPWAQSHLRAFTRSVPSSSLLQLHTLFLDSFLPFIQMPAEWLNSQKLSLIPPKKSDAPFICFHNALYFPTITHIVFLMRLLVISLFQRETGAPLRQRPYFTCSDCNLSVFHKISP